MATEQSCANPPAQLATRAWPVFPGRRTVGEVTTQAPAQASGTFTLGGDLTVNRLGYGAMRLTGKGVWGPPADRDEAVRVLRRAAELGVNFIDTANSYGPYVAEEIIREALHPYDGLVIATKAGLLRTGPDVWVPLGFPAYLRQEAELSLQRLGVETIDLFQLHRIDDKFPLEDQIGELVKLQEEGKIRHIGLSEVDVEQLHAAQKIAEIVSVQNLYNLTTRKAEALLDEVTEQGIGFIPWFPLASGPLAAPDGPLAKLGAEHGHASPSQLALAWLLKRSPVVLPIPGTSSVAHLEENVAAAEIELSDDEFEKLSALGEAGRQLGGRRRRTIRCLGGIPRRVASRRWIQPARTDSQRRAGLRPVHRRRPPIAGPRPRRGRARRGDHRGR